MKLLLERISEHWPSYLGSATGAGVNAIHELQVATSLGDVILGMLKSFLVGYCLWLATQGTVKAYKWIKALISEKRNR